MIEKNKSHNYISSYALYHIVESLVNNLVTSGKWGRIIDYTKRIRGISVYGVEVRIEVSPKRALQLLSQLLEMLNEWGGHYGRRVIIVFDEAQYLAIPRASPI